MFSLCLVQKICQNICIKVEFFAVFVYQNLLFTDLRVWIMLQLEIKIIVGFVTIFLFIEIKYTSIKDNKISFALAYI